jgi:hypothetical protein
VAQPDIFLQAKKLQGFAVDELCAGRGSKALQKGLCLSRTHPNSHPRWKKMREKGLRMLERLYARANLRNAVTKKK